MRRSVRQSAKWMAVSSSRFTNPAITTKKIAFATPAASLTMFVKPSAPANRGQ